MHIIKNSKPKWVPEHIKKSHITYEMWVKKYKCKDIYRITLNEHTAWHKEFISWRHGNIEKVY